MLYRYASADAFAGSSAISLDMFYLRRPGGAQEQDLG